MSVGFPERLNILNCGILKFRGTLKFEVTEVGLDAGSSWGFAVADALDASPPLDVRSCSIMAPFWPSWKSYFRLFDKFPHVIDGINHPRYLGLVDLLLRLSLLW